MGNIQKILIFLGVLGLALSFAYLKPARVLASCDPRYPNAYPPQIYSVNPPTGNYTNPGFIPVHITGEGGYECFGNPNGGVGNDMVDVGVSYTIFDSNGNSMYDGVWSAPRCQVVICVPRPIDVNDNVNANTWPVGTYTLTAIADGAGGTSEEFTVSFTITRTPDFSLSCSPATQTITAGSSASFNLDTTAINGFNSPVSFTHAFSNPSGTLPSITYSNNGAVPSATTVALITTTGSTTPGTYTITFTGTGGSQSHACPGEVTLIVNSNTPPTDWISCNATAGSCNIRSGDSAVIDWGSAYASSCTVTPYNWTGLSGSQTVTNITSAVTYTVSCTGPGGGPVNASVNVNIISAPNPPTRVSIDASVCEQATIDWRAARGVTPTGYKIYRSTDNVVWQLITLTPLGATATSYTDYPPVGNYYYAVTALNGNEESAKAIAGPANVHACVTDLSTSDKDITAASPVNITSTVVPCNAVSDPVTLQGGKSFKLKDTVTFRINICNTGDRAATAVQVTDTLSNLSNPSNFAYSGCSSGSASGTGPIIFNVGDVAPNSTCSISFTAKVTKPAPGSIYRFQNIADIKPSNFPNKRVLTPAYLFTDVSGNPDRQEIAP